MSPKAASPSAAKVTAKPAPLSTSLWLRPEQTDAEVVQKEKGDDQGQEFQIVHGHGDGLLPRQQEVADQPFMEAVTEAEHRQGGQAVGELQLALGHVLDRDG